MDNTNVLWVLTPESIEAAKDYYADCQALIALKESTLEALRDLTEPEDGTYLILDEAGYYELVEDYRYEYLQDVTVPDILKKLKAEVEANVSEADAEAFDLWCEENTDIVLEILRDTCSFLSEYPEEGNGLANFSFSPSKAYKAAVRATIYDTAQEELTSIKLPA